MQSIELIASSLGQNLHAAVVIIAHPSSDAQDVRLALDEPAEADPLYASAHEEPAGLDWLFSDSHF
jgi:acyl-CoA synthetase (AMP-forming)/AMP-acid ligase II